MTPTISPRLLIWLRVYGNLAAAPAPLFPTVPAPESQPLERRQTVKNNKRSIFNANANWN